jgi:hypothetical protein
MGMCAYIVARATKLWIIVVDDAIIVHASVTEKTKMTRNRVNQLVDWVQQGRIMDAMSEFYAKDVQMQENSNAPTVGLQANLAREQKFVESIGLVHECVAQSTIVDGDQAVIHWIMDYTGKDGVRIRLDQLAVQQWSDGRIVSERFVYDSGAVVQAA